jgi:hypothetical protein
MAEDDWTGIFERTTVFDRRTRRARKDGWICETAVSDEQI